MAQDPLFLVSINLLVAFVARCLSRNLLTAMILAVVVIASGAYLGSAHNREILAALTTARDRVLPTDDHTSAPTRWPPMVGQTYPDLELYDQDGRLTRLSEYRGKVLLIEPVAMSCPACVAFSGGHVFGSFQGISPQANLEAIDIYVERFGRVPFDHPDLVFVQLVLFDRELAPPSAEDVRRWADHFGFQRSQRHLVLAGTPELAGPAGHALIPGFQLVDRDFTLRCDSTGPQPRHDLYRELLPHLGSLLR